MASDEWRYATNHRRDADNRGSAWAQWGTAGRNSASPHRRDRGDDGGLRRSGERPPPQKRRRHGAAGDLLPNPKAVHFVSAAAVSSPSPSSSDEHGDSRDPALSSSASSVDRQPRQQQGCTSSAPPEPGSLASNAVVAQMMRRMNYKQGTGLGRHGQGIVAPIEVALRPKNAGLGSVERSTIIGGEPPPSDENWPKWDDDEAAAGGARKKRKRGRERDVDDDKIHARHLEERAAEAVVRVQKALARSARWSSTSSSSGLGDDDDDETVAAITKAMKRVQEQRASGMLTTGELIREFAALKEKCPEGYTTHRLADTARAVVAPMLHAAFRQWEPLEDPSRGLLETVTALRGILSDDDDDDDGSAAAAAVDDSSPYAALVDDVVVRPALAAAEAWEVKDWEPMVRFLNTWRDALPVPALQRVLEWAVVPKLTAAVEQWEPRWDPEPPCHAWVLPWVPLLGRSRLEPMFVVVRRELGEALLGCHAARASADYAMVSPWKDVFGPKAWEAFVGRHVVPYLRRGLRAVRVTPPKQDDDGGFIGVMRWAPVVVSVQDMAQMLEDEFLGRWQDALCRWLWVEKPTVGEAVAWHEGWKRLLTPELLAEERVRERIEVGLEKIRRAARGLEVYGYRREWGQRSGEAHYSCSSRSR